MAEAPRKSEKAVNKDFNIFMFGIVMDKAGIHNLILNSEEVQKMFANWGFGAPGKHSDFHPQVLRDNEADDRQPKAAP